MKVMTQLKKVFSISLVIISLWVGAAFSIDLNHQALAKPNTPETGSYDYYGSHGNSVDAYRKLQRQTYSYRNDGLEGEGSQTGRLGNRVGLAERTGKKLQNRLDQRRDLTSQPNSVEDAAENMIDNTRDAFQRSGEKVKRNLN